jgi:NAD-dependent SIR2 family protein deacetylase
MKDIFDAKIMCKNCDKEMKPSFIDKNGYRLRIVQCEKCGEKIVHPGDLSNYNHFNDLKNKTFNVKLRVVGNSHAISIPKEIVDFFNETQREMHKQMNDMVKLCFEDFGRLSVRFIDSGEMRERERMKERMKKKIQEDL